MLGDMVDWTMIRDTIDAWLVAASMPYVWGGQGANPPQRARPYAVLHQLQIESLGRDGLRKQPINGDTSNIVLETFGQRIFTLQVDVIADATGTPGLNAMSHAERLASSMRTAVVRDIFFGKLGVTDITPIRDLSALEDSQIMGRASYDVRLSVGATDYPSTTTPYPTIKQAEYTGTVVVSQNPDITVVKTKLVGG